MGLVARGASESAPAQPRRGARPGLTPFAARLEQARANPRAATGREGAAARRVLPFPLAPPTGPARHLATRQKGTNGGPDQGVSQRKRYPAASVVGGAVVMEFDWPRPGIGRIRTERPHYCSLHPYTPGQEDSLTVAPRSTHRSELICAAANNCNRAYLVGPQAWGPQGCSMAPSSPGLDVVP